MMVLLYCGRSFRTLNVIDDYNREVLAIEVDTNFPSQRVTRVLDRIALEKGYPESIRVDNGPEFTSGHIHCWAEEHNVTLNFIKPGKPTQNSYIERFNRTFREDILDMYVFQRLSEVREMTENWIDLYNRERPHDSFGDMTPIEFAQSREHLTSTC